jgi:hypothetical protein
MLTAADLSRDIVFDASDPVLLFAAEELRHQLNLAASPGTASITLQAGSGEADGFTVAIDRGSALVHGDNSRGALNGVYWLLEQLGFAWPDPFTPATLLPLSAGARRGGRGVRSIAAGEYRETPAFSRRTLILGQDALHDDWPAWIEWASRNRYNDVFFHDTPPSVWDRGGKQRPTTADELDADRKGWMFERWDADGPRIAAEARKRGLTLQFGGHHLPTLLPRDEFERHPDWFPLRNGARNPKYNVCTATPELREYLARRTEDFLTRFPGADVYHMWADDIRGGGWCECATCGAMSPSDQALLATNLVAEAVARALPSAKVAHLAYHDTLEPPTIEPHENVTALFAPRERCYAHAIDDSACERNVPDYWEPFMRFARLFPAGRMQVFEYYSDAILFKGLAPTHLWTLPGDARAYQSAGVWNIGNLMVGDRPWVGPAWHAWWTARRMWHTSADFQSELAVFCGAAYGEHAAGMVQYYRAAEEAYRRILDLHDLEPKPRHDVLDYSDAPRGTLTRKAADLRGAVATLASLATRELAGSERTQAAFVTALASHLAHRLTAWDRAHEGARDATLAALAEAETALADIKLWDARHNTPAYAVVARTMRRAMAWHIDEIRRLLDAR